MFRAASWMSGYSPAPTAASMQEPSTTASPTSVSVIGTPVTSECICIQSRLLVEPPQATISLTSKPADCMARRLWAVP